MAYGVLVLNRVMATNVDSLNASAVSGSNLENGSLIALINTSGSTGFGEVFYGIWPTSGSLSGLYMVASPENVVTTVGNASFRGLSQDPRNFINIAGCVVDVFKPMIGDVILMSEDCFTGAKSSNTHAVATADTWQLVWGTTGGNGTTTSFKYLSTEYISVGSGSAIGGQRLTAYRMQCIYN